MKNAKQAIGVNPLTSDSTIQMSIKEIISVIIFLVTLGMTISGILDAKDIINSVSEKIRLVDEQVKSLSVKDNDVLSEIGKVNIKLEGVKETAEFVRNQCLTVKK